MYAKKQGKPFSDEIMMEVRRRFHYLQEDPMRPGRRIFFDNAGGSFRLKSALESFNAMDSLPDSPERTHETARFMNSEMEKAEHDIRTLLNAKSGNIVSMLTASQVLWLLTGTIAENVPGTNIVTTKIEHPSAYDAARFFAQKTGQEFRAADANLITGGVDATEIARHIDENTSLLTVIYASNVSGAVLDIAGIVKAARAKKPDLHIIVDAVQHAPHGVIDVDALGIDGIVIAPYKFFGVRGSGIGYASTRVSQLPHPRLLGKPQDTWTLGSPAPGHSSSISRIVDYICWLGSKDTGTGNRREMFLNGMNMIRLQECALMHRMLEGTREISGLRHLPGITVFLDGQDYANRDFILAIGMEGWGAAEAVREYERHGIIVSERTSSSIYSRRILEAFGIEECIRISPLHCNTLEEIDEFNRVTANMLCRKSQPRAKGESIS